MRGIYLYGLTADAPRLEREASEVRGLPDGTTSCRVVESAGLAVLVSEYDGPALADLEKSDLLQSLLVHQQVLDRIVPNVSVLPIKFGTVLASEDEVRSVVERYQETLQAAVAEVGNAVEIDLSANWDSERILADIRRDPAIGDAVGAAEGDLAARIQLGQSVQEAVESRREEYRRRIVGELLPLTVDAQPNPRPMEDMVANVAFLVEQDRLDEFESRVDRLGDELGDLLTFRYVGPLPPYSFATIAISRVDPARLEAARRLLDVSENASEQEIAAHYRELAARSHPDSNQGDPTASERFAALTGARDELMRYVGSGGNERGRSTPLLLDVVRSDSTAAVETEAWNATGAPS